MLMCCSTHGLLSFRTSQYKLNFFETPTGLKFVLNTDLSVGNIRDVLQQIYSQVLIIIVINANNCYTTVVLL